MKVSDFDYELPPELIAQRPSPERGASRMLVMRRDSGGLELRPFQDFPEFVEAGDCLVLNDTRVIPARLFGRREGSGGRVEAFLLEEVVAGRWRCLLRPARRLHPGARVAVDGGSGGWFTVAAKQADGSAEIVFECADVPALLEEAGRTPLPPYIRREADANDRERYQTIYARKPGAVAAPTAGLHFTPEILRAVVERAVRVARVTLHVGAGTFKPVTAERLEDHTMHEETFEMSSEAADAVNRTIAAGKRIIAVGTTSVRVLESCARADRRGVHPARGATRLFLHPPMAPGIADALLTNFHLPRSTLLMLVSCFSEVNKVLAAYRFAVEQRMRFYSYGDCMLMLPG